MQNCANYGQHLLPQASGLGSGTVGVWCQGVVVAVWGHGKLWGGGSKEGRKPTQATSKTSLLLEMAFNYSLVVQEVADVG